MKRNVILMIVMICLFLGGCISTTHRSNPVFFEDSGNAVDNYKECYRLMNKACESSPNCVGSRIDKLECEDGRCYCD